MVPPLACSSRIDHQGRPYAITISLFWPLTEDALNALFKVYLTRGENVLDYTRLDPTPYFFRWAALDRGWAPG